MLALGGPARASTAQYVVVFDQSASTAAYAASATAGGRILGANALGIATVASSSAAFATALRSSSAIVGVALNAGFPQGATAKTANPPKGTHTQADEAAAC